MTHKPTNHRIIFGDSRSLKELPDHSVHLVITSPPYWQLKDYQNGDQIGFNDSYEDYINNLNLVWSECNRVLHNGCRLCINVGDQFARSVYYGRYKVIPIRTEITRFCETIGFDYMGAVIWQKVTTCNTTGGATVMGSFPYPRNGIIKLDYEFILIFKKQGLAPKPSDGAKKQSILTTEEWNTYFNGHWNFPGERQVDHIAAFPEELPRRLIRMFSFVGETVLDPFLGSGTTTLAAANLQRDSVGYEVNAGYESAIRRRLNLTNGSIFEPFKVEMHNRLEAIDLEHARTALPYIFKDPVRLNRKVDPHQLMFGSKISSTSPKREEYHTVKKILSSEILELGSGLKVRLLGVRSIPDREEEAIAHLRQLVNGQKVYLRFDAVKHDTESNLLSYLYLSNRLFVNRKLIESSKVNLDDRYPCGKLSLSVKDRRVAHDG